MNAAPAPSHDTLRSGATRRPDVDVRAAPRFVRRARPLLGTLVDIGVRAGPSRSAVDAAIVAAFARIAVVQRRLSRFQEGSDIARFNAAPAGARIEIGVDTQHVLAAARVLSDASDGLFDVTLGSGGDDWRCDRNVLCKRRATTRIDLGGIGKGHAVDAAVDALLAAGIEGGWVNAGGDLRAFGAASVPIDLRDEDGGGVRRFARLADGAFATSRLPTLEGAARHASVAARLCLWADALTKIVVASGDARHPLLGRFGARAWLHPVARTRREG
ncbi:MAG TPA: FAD:protein FMN transferase [Caldimonas sp.]|nr:FAD:protein FMN transferase [Caldimonas sp.]